MYSLVESTRFNPYSIVKPFIKSRFSFPFSRFSLPSKVKVWNKTLPRSYCGWRPTSLNLDFSIFVLSWWVKFLTRYSLTLPHSSYMEITTGTKQDLFCVHIWWLNTDIFCLLANMSPFKLLDPETPWFNGMFSTRYSIRLQRSDSCLQINLFITNGW